MSEEGTYTDFWLKDPMIEEIDGKFVIYSADTPGKKYKVVELLDGSGDPVDDIEIAAGGVFKAAESSYMVFML